MKDGIKTLVKTGRIDHRFTRAMAESLWGSHCSWSCGLAMITETDCCTFEMDVSRKI